MHILCSFVTLYLNTLFPRFDLIKLKKDNYINFFLQYLHLKIGFIFSSHFDLLTFLISYHINLISLFLIYLLNHVIHLWHFLTFVLLNQNLLTVIIILHFFTLNYFLNFLLFFNIILIKIFITSNFFLNHWFF